jgi:hypothetical protein
MSAEHSATSLALDNVQLNTFTNAPSPPPATVHEPIVTTAETPKQDASAPESLELAAAKQLLGGLVVFLSMDDEKLKTSAAIQICNLSVKDERYIAALAKAGAIPILAKLLTQPPYLSQAASAAALSNIGSVAAYKEAIARENVLENLIILLGSQDERCRVQAAGALWSICAHSDPCRKRAVDSGAVPLLCNVWDYTLSSFCRLSSKNQTTTPWDKRWAH